MNKSVYWEKQMDLMCGVHCVNALMQGPFNNQVSLSNIALNLDARQRQLMAQQGMTSDFLKYARQQSGNVAEDGNYSLQVLAQSLKQVSNDMNIVSIDTIHDKSLLTLQTGFICNSSSHWLAIRKIGNQWYNLNSTNKKMPEIISDFYLSAFIVSVKQNGYQVFVVRGTYPETYPETFQHYNKNQFWFDAKRIKNYQQKRMSRQKNFKLNIGGTDQKAYRIAIKRSLNQPVSQEEQISEDQQQQLGNKKKQPTFQAYKGDSTKLNIDDIYTNYPKFDLIDVTSDPELFFSVRMSMQESLQNIPKNGIQVIFRLQNGQKFSRKFQKTDTIQSLYDYVFLKLTEQELGKKIKFYLSQSVTKTKLIDVNLPIFALGEEQRFVIFVNNL